LRWPLPIAALAALLLTAGIGAGFFRVAELESNELLYESPSQTLAELERGPGSTRVSARLAAVNLGEGEQAFFEVCFQDGLPAGRWQDALELLVWKVNADNLRPLLRVPLDRSRLQRARRGAGGACLQLGGFRVPESGRHALDAVWLRERPAPRLMRVGLYARVIARTPLERLDLLYVAAIALGTFIGLSALFFHTLARSGGGRPGTTAPSPPFGAEGEGAAGPRARLRARLLAALLGVVCTAAVWAVVTWLPLWGSAMGLLKGLSILATELCAAVFLVSRLGSGNDRLTDLGLRAPGRSPWLWLSASAVTAVALVLTARTALSLVPATGEAPIQTFVSWPSGMLSFAVLGMVVPVGEEVFFRGFVYRAALGLGRWAAFAITVILFVAMHAQQSWGNWGGLVALLVTGTALTGLRAASGSALVPAFSHLLYNLILSFRSL
jgi:membrane protease YdiL (CAAX protease family)